jgi:hypothetical protein
VCFLGSAPGRALFLDRPPKAVRYAGLALTTIPCHAVQATRLARPFSTAKECFLLTIVMFGCTEFTD